MFCRATIASVYIKPIRPLWTVAKRVFRYIAGTMCTGILYKALQDGLGSIVGCSDSDWAGWNIDVNKTTRIVISVERRALSSMSKKQPVFMTSTFDVDF